ncbi:FAD-binding oxidoreductase [Neorhizobium sp. P12A]|uniref:NAD(P)/FAD-dependent oxidoreductase n=1 Tax=Neorhizobium sp. P12A TaxID=2268027 RepID=UPI0011EFFFE5|nr:FAD-binding oxidoreductase [Neorhizobium sp. P12A]KAA0701031.1 FAD-binding oxidoreductase [Neorhizobium sp. P12A]
MPSSQKIIVIGAGIIGASIAWHLARRGASVTVIAKKPGGEATPNSFAWINASWGNPEFYFRFRSHAMTEWKRLAEELPGLPLNWCGGLCWDLPPDQLEAYASEHGGWGYGVRRVAQEESAVIEPGITELPDLALHIAEEGAVEPVAAARLMLADAFRYGTTFLQAVEVERLLIENGRIVGIETSNGRLSADHVILAAGAGTSGLAASVGVDVPLETPPGLIVHSRPYTPLLNGLVIAPELHMRQTAEGRIIAGSDFGGSDPGDEPQKVADTLFAKVKAMLRDADGLELDFFTVGYRPTPKDGFPIIGPSDAVAGLYLTVMHSGITLAPLVGQLAADEVLGERRDSLLAPFRLSRFSAA